MKLFNCIVFSHTGYLVGLIVIFLGIFGGLLTFLDVLNFLENDFMLYGLFLFLALLGVFLIFLNIFSRKMRFSHSSEKASEDEYDLSEMKIIDALDRQVLTLNNLEIAQLIWIFRTGYYETDKPVTDSLIEKKLVRRATNTAFEMYIVPRHIWRQRHEFLSKFHQVYSGGQFPGDSGSERG